MHTTVITRFNTFHPAIRLLIAAAVVTLAAYSAVTLQTATLGWLRGSWGVPSYGGW